MIRPAPTRRTANDYKYHRRIAQTGGVNRFAFKRAGQAEFTDSENREYIRYARVLPHIKPMVSNAQVYADTKNSREVRYTVHIPSNIPSSMMHNSHVHLTDTKTHTQRTARVVGVYQLSPSYRTYNVDLRF